MRIGFGGCAIIVLTVVTFALLGVMMLLGVGG